MFPPFSIKKISAPLSRKQAFSFYKEKDLYALLYLANRLRQKYFGNKIRLCSIINAKSGRCPEDCKYCAQSAFYNTGVKKYPIVSVREILLAAKKARMNNASGFSIVTSGKGISDKREFSDICRAVEKISRMGLYACVSLGETGPNELRALKNAGLKRYHHNLETSPGMFGKICSTHSYSDKIKTLEAVKKSGLGLCSGGIFGLGETYRDRIELAFILKDFNPDSVPLNFLSPVRGTPLYKKAKPIPPLEILRIIALFRFIFPSKDIKICGGREKNLRDLQSWMYYAGANGSMAGNYLTTSGRPAAEDLQMLEDLELVPVS